MKTIIAGSRTITDYLTVVAAITASGFHITEVVSGKEPKGVDALGERWAMLEGIPIKAFPADWDTYGRPAGQIRNRQMARYADALILVWDGQSKGSTGMLRYAKEMGLEIFECVVSPNGVEYRRHPGKGAMLQQRSLF